MATRMIGDYSKYPDSIRDHLPYLIGEVCELRQSWAVFHQLFIENPDYTEMMAERLGSLLAVLQRLLQDAMLLSISRLTDRDSKHQSNLSVWCLTECVKDATSSGFGRRMQEMLSDIDSASVGIRKHRHKRLAHSDLHVSLKTAILPKVIFRDVRMQIERLEALLNLVQKEFADVTMIFDALVASDTSGTAEITVRKAKAYDLFEARGVIPKNAFWEER